MSLAHDDHERGRVTACIASLGGIARVPRLASREPRGRCARRSAMAIRPSRPRRGACRGAGGMAFTKFRTMSTILLRRRLDR